jgi:serine/threonine kinase PknH
MALIWMHQTEPPPSLREGFPGIPAAVEAVVMQALRKESDQRPTAEEFAGNLARAVGQEGGVVGGSVTTGVDPVDEVTRVTVARPPAAPAPSPDDEKPQG